MKEELLGGADEEVYAAYKCYSEMAIFCRKLGVCMASSLCNKEFRKQQKMPTLFECHQLNVQTQRGRKSQIMYLCPLSSYETFLATNYLQVITQFLGNIYEIKLISVYRRHSYTCL
jgi:hypothetical protein